MSADQSARRLSFFKLWSNETYEQREEHSRLIVTEDLQNAIERCRRRVQRISEDCRKRNRRFRDIEFDLEEDQESCLYGLWGQDEAEPLDVLRVGEIFDKPKFMINGATGDDLVQGRLADCWFLSALATVSTVPDLINKICVDSDPAVGVYGFIFYRDGGWVDVIVDDLLCIYAQKYEDLSEKEKYHFRSDKKTYNGVARSGSKSLYYASSGTENETWVPLIEKAFAKLHGDYEALNYGWTCEAVESLTGGVSNCFYLHDIFDEDRFWEEELSRLRDGAEKDRVFSCVITNETSGLRKEHAYSIMEAAEHRGKRFLKIRNPWGSGEWIGPWSDGSKEWSDFPDIKPSDLNHKFGDDGEFIMEYKDFLSTWTYVDRTRLFDDCWIISSLWLNVVARSLPCAWNYGDVSFTLHVEKDTPAVIVLSRLDDRHFQELSGCFHWSLDFAIYKQGTNELVGVSTHERLWHRSVNLELDLDEGNYVIHPRLDRKKKRKAHTELYHDKEGGKPGIYIRAQDQSLSTIRKQRGAWDIRKLGRKWASAYTSRRIAINFEPERFGDVIHLDDDIFTGRNLAEIQAQRILSPISGEDVVFVHHTVKDLPSNTAFVTSPDQLPDDALHRTFHPSTPDVDVAAELSMGLHSHRVHQEPPATKHQNFECNICKTRPILGTFYRCMECHQFDICRACMDQEGHQHGSHITLRVDTAADANKLKDDVHGRLPHPEDYEVTLGLRVYTKKEAPTIIGGQLRQGKILRSLPRAKQQTQPMFPRPSTASSS